MRRVALLTKGSDDHLHDRPARGTLADDSVAYVTQR